MRFATTIVIALIMLLGITNAAMADASAGPGAGLGMGLAIIGIGIGIGLVGYSAISGIARQPEQAGAIQGAMLILAALIEGAGIIALVLCLVLLFIK